MCVRWVCARWAEQRESVEVEVDQPTGHQSERDGRTVHIVVVVVRDNSSCAPSWQESDHRRLLGRGGLTSEVSRQGSRGVVVVVVVGLCSW